MEPDELGGDPSLGYGLEYSRLISEGMTPQQAREALASRHSTTELEARLREENAELRRTIESLSTRIDELETRLDSIMARLEDISTREDDGTESETEEDTEDPGTEGTEDTDEDEEDEEAEEDGEDDGADDTDTPDIPPPTPYADSDLPERVRDSDVRVAEAARVFDDAVREFARLRVSRERPFGGRHQEGLDRAGQRLVEATEELQAALAEQETIKGIGFEQREEEINIQKRYLARRIQLARIEADRASAEGNLERLEEASQRLLDLERRDNDLDRQLMDIGRERGQSQIALNERINQMVIETQQRVDTEMEAERERRNPILARLGRWARNNRAARLLVSAGMVGISLVGFATANVPLIVAGMAGRAALGAIGGYNLGAGAGELLSRRGFNSSARNNMSEYVQAAGRQSGTRSAGKTVGVGLGAIFGALPIVRGIGQLAEVSSATPSGSGGGGPIAPDSISETTPPTPNFPNPTEIATNPGMDEWNYVAYEKGVGGQAWGKIMEIIDTLSKEGWQFEGRNLHFPVDATGPGSGHLETIIAPDGTRYSGLAQVNGMLGNLIDTRFGTAVPPQYLE